MVTDLETVKSVQYVNGRTKKYLRSRDKLKFALNARSLWAARRTGLERERRCLSHFAATLLIPEMTQRASVFKRFLSEE